jgi:hypothetical protein
MLIKRNGSTRLVILIGKWAVKVPKVPNSWYHFLYAILQNLNERNTWHWNSGRYEQGKSHLLCPVIWCSMGGWVLIMRRALPISRAIFESESALSEHSKYFPGDDDICNYGLINGKIVKVDYGSLK